MGLSEKRKREIRATARVDADRGDKKGRPRGDILWDEPADKEAKRVYDDEHDNQVARNKRDGSLT